MKNILLLSFTEGKGHTRSDSKSDANVSKSSLKDFLQNFMTRRKNLQEIEAKGIYKSKKNNFGSRLKMSAIILTDLQTQIEKENPKEIYLLLFRADLFLSNAMACC